MEKPIWEVDIVNMRNEGRICTNMSCAMRVCQNESGLEGSRNLNVEGRDYDGLEKNQNELLNIETSEEEMNK